MRLSPESGRDGVETSPDLRPHVEQLVISLRYTIKVIKTHRVLLKRPNDLPVPRKLERSRLHRLRIEELKDIVEGFRVLFDFHDGQLIFDGLARRRKTPCLGRGKEKAREDFEADAAVGEKMSEQSGKNEDSYATHSLDTTSQSPSSLGLNRFKGERFPGERASSLASLVRLTGHAPFVGIVERC